MSSKKSIVITGASTGLGAAFTKALAQDGHDLFVCAREIDRLAMATTDLPAVFRAACDVASAAEVQTFFDQVRERSRFVDVLIHCAGVLGPVGPSIDIDSDAWFSAVKTNLFGAFLVTKHVVPLMQAERRPRIILLSGGGAFDPMPHVSAYAASKAAITRMAETLAVELAPHNIAVNMLAPGFVPTKLFDPMMHAGASLGGAIYDKVQVLLEEWKDEDIEVPVGCVRFLISDAAAPLTGKTISARFDPWGEPEFISHLSDIVTSDLYTSRRTNLADLSGQDFANRLAGAADNRRQRVRKDG